LAFSIILNRGVASHGEENERESGGDVKVFHALCSSDVVCGRADFIQSCNDSC
jgi:hypothetical protein